MVGCGSGICFDISDGSNMEKVADGLKFALASDRERSGGNGTRYVVSLKKVQPIPQPMGKHRVIG
jgi:hypothetical protein